MSDGYFSIKSVRSDAELVFAGGEGNYFIVELRGSELSARCLVWGDSHSADLAERLTNAAKQTSGFDEFAWGSLEDEITLSFRCDKIGHVFIRIEMRNRHGVDDWRLASEIETELGQLPGIAEKAERFFRNIRLSDTW